MSFNTIKHNQYINSFDIQYIKTDKEFNIDEIEMIQDIFFDDFDGTDINIKRIDNGNNILMELLINMQDNMLENKLAINIVGKDAFIQAYTYLFAKIALNEEFNINSMNYKNSNLLSNLIGLNEIDLIKFILENRNDIKTNYYDSKFGDTYLDLAEELGHFEVYNLIKLYNNEKRY